MAEPSDIRTGRHGVFVSHAHLVFATEYRHLARMQEIMRAV